MKIIVISSHTSSLFWFRMDMMKSFIVKGHTVIAIGPLTDTNWINKFHEQGIDYYGIRISRNGLNPITDLKTLHELVRILRKEEPEKIFAYQAKSIIYGSLAAKICKISNVYLMIAGLGSIFRGSGFKNQILRLIISIQYKLACSIAKKVFVQNPDDMNELVSRKIVNLNKVVMINGSGVNLDVFKKADIPNEPVFLYIGRLIRDKGVFEYLEACRKIREIFPNYRCMLVGPFDTNPSALKEFELNSYIDNGIIEYYGEQEDVKPFIEKCSIFVLPSYHEGTPKTVLEAMAMGRPIITSDAPGCRETVIDGLNGYLIPTKNIQKLIEKMIYLANNPDQVYEMGEQSLKLVKEKYDICKVNESISIAMDLQ